MKRILIPLSAAVAVAALGTRAAEPPPIDDSQSVYGRVDQRRTVTLKHPWTISAQGGIEGYSSDVGGALSNSPIYGVSLQLEPWRFLGFELGYNGAVNQTRLNASNTVIRNGGYAAITPGYSFALGSEDVTDVKPYVLGGIGYDSYAISSGAGAQGFSAANTTTVPLGAGLRFRFGQFSLDGRWVATNELSNGLTPTSSKSVRNQGLVQAGVNF